MGTLSTAVSGLMANQRGLEVTAHNLSNVNTIGYVRQQEMQADYHYSTIGYYGNNALQVGSGVDISEVRQIRDQFLDLSYRTEVGRKGYYSVSKNTVDELEIILGEIEGEGLSDVLNDLKESINTLSKSPDGLEARGIFLENAVLFADKANYISEQIGEYQVSLNEKVENTVDEINSLANNIAALNKKIVDAEMSGDQANDYRDQRNGYLDRLSELVDIKYKEYDNGSVKVSAEGRILVDHTSTAEITLVQTEPGSPFTKPVWSDTGQDVINLSESVSSEKDNDKGLLKGLLLTRGSRTANYTDAQDSSKYSEIEDSLIMRTQAQFDLLVHEVVTMINDIVSPKTSGSPSTQDLANAPYGLDGSQFTEVFVRDYYDRFDDSGNFIEEDPTSPSTLYSAGNISVNPELLNDYNKLALNKNLGDLGDNEILQDILKQWDAETISLDPNSTYQSSVSSAYNDFVSILGSSGNEATNHYDNQEQMVTQIDNQRSMISGVSSDEELGNMIKFQHAYNASARVVSIVDSMIDQIVNRMGIVGR